ncbi:hypothetical protein GALMADRAFT_936876 [Galerina marginata CBS 339.88]|uniref:Uncharacterized protein n=1 Tax=Galerina marginata (strain CBS 339.88) TaxID=685588 RepID=A0A067SDE6_GALM3|nr:hypothetical protein GALMADRAFT_936876 [Galerina marginata CBS 339.88]
MSVPVSLSPLLLTASAKGRRMGAGNACNAVRFTTPFKHEHLNLNVLVLVPELPSDSPFCRMRRCGPKLSLAPGPLTHCRRSDQHRPNHLHIQAH